MTTIADIKAAVEDYAIWQADLVRDEYAWQIVALNNRIKYLEEKLRSIGIDPDEEWTYSQTLDMARVLDRIPL